MKLLSLSESVTRLVESGVMDKDKKQKEQGLKRLLQNNVILGVKPPSNQPKIGWKVDQDSLEEYIEIGLMSKVQMMKELLEVRRELKSLKSSTDPLRDLETSEGLIPTEPSESPKMDGLRTSETTDFVGEDVKTIKNEEKTDSTSLVISKMEIISEEGLHLYQVKFLLNKEVRYGTVSDDTNEDNPMIQFIELWDENHTKVYEFGDNEEDNKYLESLSFKTDKNVKRKLTTFKKNLKNDDES